MCLGVAEAPVRRQGAPGLLVTHPLRGTQQELLHAAQLAQLHDKAQLSVRGIRADAKNVEDVGVRVRKQGLVHVPLPLNGNSV
jgi:hypothetical protein